MDRKSRHASSALQQVTPRIRRRGRDAYMTARDVAAFSAALKLELPDLVFSYIDPGMAAITYFDSLEYVNSGRRFSREASTAFLRPANWQPQWVVSDPDPGAYFRY